MLMTHKEAMLLVDNGHTVRRRGRDVHVVNVGYVYSDTLRDWIKPFKVSYKKGELGVGESAEVYAPSHDDLKAADWVVVE